MVPIDLVEPGQLADFLSRAGVTSFAMAGPEHSRASLKEILRLPGVWLQHWKRLDSPVCDVKPASTQFHTPGDT